MSDLDKLIELGEKELNEVSGGIEDSEALESDPLFQRFSAFWSNAEKMDRSGMYSRVRFLSAFRKWVQSGIPNNIKEWYEGLF
ncbi:MAG: hypothetical protein J6O55_07165 [Lachnospiraceae bacterium]|nr:hypothetical protein [Lachnospiraceae bacterium]